MANERKNITQPADWWVAWTEAAAKEKLNLSQWIGKQCNRSLKIKLTERAKPGRPTEKGQHPKP
jgi:hypothetical protein